MTFSGHHGDEPLDEYDRFVDWDKRLAREGPFFHRLFDEHGVDRVVDVGCGTGRHAALFASWGLDVVGVDPSASMLEQARAHATATGSTARFEEGGFGDLVHLGLGTVDAVTCTGNALPHVDGLGGLRRALADFARVVRGGGIVVLHLLNHDRLLASHPRAMPPVVRDADDGTWVFLRVLDYVDAGIGFDFIRLRRTDVSAGETVWETSSRRSVHAALPSSVLVGELEAAGFSDVRLFGSHERTAFDPAVDESVIMVATKV